MKKTDILRTRIWGKWLNLMCKHADQQESIFQSLRRKVKTILGGGGASCSCSCCCCWWWWFHLCLLATMFSFHNAAPSYIKMTCPINTCLQKGDFRLPDLIPGGYQPFTKLPVHSWAWISASSTPSATRPSFSCWPVRFNTSVEHNNLKPTNTVPSGNQTWQLNIRSFSDSWNRTLKNYSVYKKGFSIAMFDYQFDSLKWSNPKHSPQKTWLSSGISDDI